MGEATWRGATGADPGAAFTELVRRPEHAIALDEGALLIASHAHAGLDVAAQLHRLDRLADTCPSADRVALVEHLFTTCGFAGDRQRYYDPRNSFLDEVLDRRRGIPITLAVVMIEVGRRLGLDLFGVGMPGHFLVGSGDGALLDPFDGGRGLDLEGARELYASVKGADAPFQDRYLAPVGPRSVLARILANLHIAYQAIGDLESVSWALRLASVIPGTDKGLLLERARVELRLGRYERAALSLEELAPHLDGEGAGRARAEATRLRARLN